MPNRIFDLLENVARYGPITLDQLTARTGISRSATFRGLKRLEDGGWVRSRLNGRQYVLTSRVERKLNTKIEPKEEIEQLIPVINKCIDLRAIRVRVFQQETTATVELVDDSVYNSAEKADHAMAFECGAFLLYTLQYGDLAVGKAKLDKFQVAKAEILLRKLLTCNYVTVSEQRFLWIPLFSHTSEVFLLCLSQRDLSQINCNVGNALVECLKRSRDKVNLQVIENYANIVAKIDYS